MAPVMAAHASGVAGSRAARRMDRRNAHAVRRHVDGLEYAPHFVATQDGRELLLAWWTGQIEDRPVAAERLFIEEPERGQRLRDRRGSPCRRQLHQIGP